MEKLKKFKGVLNSLQNVSIQDVMDIYYEYWENQDLSQSGVDQWFRQNYGDFALMCVQIGNLNYQVENGGFIQYYDNGYASTIDGGDFDENIERHEELTKNFKEFFEYIKGELNSIELTVMLTYIKIISNFSIDIDHDQYIKEDCYECDGYGYDHENECECDYCDDGYVEVDNDYYKCVSNDWSLNQLNKEYYTINSSLLKILNSTLKKIGGRNIKIKDTLNVILR